MARRDISVIRGLSILSALGASRGTGVERWQSALRLDAAPCQGLATVGNAPIFPLAHGAEALVRDIAGEDPCRRLDRATHLAVAAARGTFAMLNESCGAMPPVGCISIGSSRGPTAALEETVRQFDAEGRVGTLTSPVTTAGNVSSWVAQEYLKTVAHRSEEPAVATIGTSMTCTSAFHSLLVARSFVMSGMAESALFGGAEACLTPYTVAQLQALRIYGKSNESWPCRPLCAQGDGANTVVLGEGAGTALLLPVESQNELLEGDLLLLGIGWSVEPIPSPTGVSPDGAAFERAMRMALESAPRGTQVGGVVAHAPGSRFGDEAELTAIRSAFGDVPVYSTKHLTGHTYGASGMVSLGLAAALLSGHGWPGFPYDNRGLSDKGLPSGSAILVNAAGFGGNAISVLINRP
jgi:3-oxoacyl-[acyl-carrier-protein] synthase II